MRARLALDVTGVQTELREVVLRDKPKAFLEASPSATVPCLVTENKIIDESLDLMIWALDQNDPEGWLDMPALGHELITQCDGPFKAALDRTKYATRYPDEDPEEHRLIASAFLKDLNAKINGNIFDRPSLADAAILPFVRQFAFIDKSWFDGQPWPKLQAWLNTFLASDRFDRIMPKYAPWQPGAAPVPFPAEPLRH